MEVQLRTYQQEDEAEAREIWNEVVDDGVAFPQTEELQAGEATDFFGQQTYTGVAIDPSTGHVVGLYILHPNNVGRCGHICNASYAVKKGLRNQHIGEQLVKDCQVQAKAKGFRILQFNAVVKSNASALHLYQKLGFVQLGTIPGGFRLPDGSYEDIIVHYCLL